MCLTLVCLPLLGAVFSGFGGFCFGNKGSSILSTVCVFFSFFFSVLCFFKLGVDGQTVTFTLFPWIHSGLFYMNWGFLFDSLTAVILVVVTGISAMVHLYSISYIEGDPHRSRFISYLSFFTFFILILVTADNFMQMFVGWEGVGLCSYLLINFWFTRIQANKAAIKAMIINRIGDFGLALGIFFIFYQFGSVDYATVFCMAPIGSEISISFYFFEYSFNVVTIICLLLFVGSVGKSAQLGLHTWLPDAIEGPTPVSALIHAATMVTAGVFLLVRCSSLFEYSSFALIVVTVFGAITAFFAATTGIVQNDLKKVIAYSTCSQLGYIIFACGLSSYSVGMFHLANHAVFKALLFLTAGSVIHAISDEQDIRKMGGLLGLLPFSYASMFVGSLALTGFPFLTGYYSKDLILEVAYGSYTFNGHFAHFFGSLAAFFTAFYSIRLIYLTFISEPRGFKKVYENVHEGSLYISFPLFILSFGSIFVGYLFKDIIVGVGSDFFKHAVFTHPQNLYLIEAEFIPHSVKLIPILFSFIGFISSFFLFSSCNSYIFNFKKSFLGRRIYSFLNRKWFFDKVYTELFGQSSLIIGYYSTYKNLDRGVFEIFGPYGISFFLYNKAASFSKLHSGFIYHYSFIIISGLFFFLVLFTFNLGFVSIFDTRLFLVFFFFFIILFFYWVYSSVVEQSPFKSFVEGSNPSTPTKIIFLNL